MPYLSVRECLYSMWGMVTCLVTVPISEVTSITTMEVTLFGIYIPQRLLDLTSYGLTHLTPGGILSRLRFNMFRVTTSSILHGRTNEVALDEHNPAFFLFFGQLIWMRYDLVDFHYTISYPLIHMGRLWRRGNLASPDVVDVSELTCHVSPFYWQWVSSIHFSEVNATCQLLIGCVILNA